jgi:hypothetical protein
MNRIGLAALLWVLLCPTGLAISVKTLNLVQMVEKADKVFDGICLSKQILDENSNIPIVEYKFQVKKAIKGATDGETIVFRQVAGSEVGRPGIPGVPQYNVGQELVLFLRKESRRGLTSPVGLGQGTFLVHKNGPGNVEVMNLVGNRNLLFGLTGDRPAGLTAQEAQVFRSGRAIPLTSFATVVNKVINLTVRTTGTDK